MWCTCFDLEIKDLFFIDSRLFATFFLSYWTVDGFQLSVDSIFIDSFGFALQRFVLDS